MSYGQPTEAQLAAEKKLKKQGFTFQNWIWGQLDMSCEQPTMVLVKHKSRHSREYREICPDGTVN